MDLPLPLRGIWHLHGSPPCKKVSAINQERNDKLRERGVGLVTWFIKYALDSTADTWSMEQVNMPCVVEAVEAFMKADSPYKSRVSYTVVNMYNYGVPQARKRLIAGTPELIRRVKAAGKTVVHRSVQNVIQCPKGTHVRNELYNNTRKKRKQDGTIEHIHTKVSPDECCRPISGPAYTVTASNGLRWANPGTGYVRFTRTVSLFVDYRHITILPYKITHSYRRSLCGGRDSRFVTVSSKQPFSMTTKEVSAIQTFPANYILPPKKNMALQGIGNAVPPLFMKLLLQEATKLNRKP